MEKDEMKDLIEWLRHKDESSIPERIKRIVFWISEYGEPDHLLIPGAEVSFTAFQEMRLAYINGHFLSCIVLAQLFLEHLWFSYIALTDEEYRGRFFSDLIAELLRRKWISAEEHSAMDRLRRLRNPYVHRRSLDDPDHPSRRALDSYVRFTEVVEEDARSAIKVVFMSLSKQHFRIRS